MGVNCQVQEYERHFVFLDQIRRGLITEEFDRSKPSIR
jgi:hypothetical protein